MKVLAIAKDGNFLRLVEVNSSGKTHQILSSKAVSFNDYQASLDDNLNIASSLSCQKVYHKKLSFPFRSKSKIAAALSFQIESLPISVETHSIHIFFQSESKDKTECLLSAAAFEDVEKVLDDFKNHSLFPSWIGSDSQNFTRFIQKNKLEGVDLLFHLGVEESFLFYIEDKEVIHSFFLPFGATQIASMVSGSSMDKINRDQVEILNLQIERLVQFIKEKYTNPLKELSILSVGYASTFYLFDNLMGVKKFEVNLDDQELLFAKEIGCALDVLAKDNRTIQFLNDHLTPKKHSNILKRKVFQLGALMMCAFLVCGTGVYLKKSRSLSHLKTNLKYQLSQASLKSFSPTKFTSLQLFSEYLDDLDYQLSKRKLFYDITSEPFHVSQLLKLISSFQQSLSSESIVQVYFELVQMPTPKKPKLKYKALIKVGFTSQEDASLFAQFIKDEKSEVKEVKIYDQEEESVVQFYIS
ncbi:MAG: hypothetical protein P0S95_08375 [Rhabdochlamydiaceae bacterium]|nr:hypothetical protein [Candidatus Amphrikana amoebophyrae]